MSIFTKKDTELIEVIKRDLMMEVKNIADEKSTVDEMDSALDEFLDELYTDVDFIEETFGDYLYDFGVEKGIFDDDVSDEEIHNFIVENIEDFADFYINIYDEMEKDIKNIFYNSAHDGRNDNNSPHAPYADGRPY